MEAIYHQAKSIGYNATRFLQMLREHGGLETAHQLLSGDGVSYGFTELWLRGRPDLTVEALALQPEYVELFSDAELAGASERLGRGTWHRHEQSRLDGTSTPAAQEQPTPLGRDQ
jgi:hypothetical protein